MKKIKLTIVLALISIISFAQEGPFFGANFAYNTTWLMNKQVFDKPSSEIAPEVSFGSYYGLIAGYNFNDEVGIELNFNINNIKQKYSGNIWYLGGDFVSTTHIQAIDIPLLFKFGMNSYFELGPVLQILNGATFTSTNNNLIVPNISNRDDLDEFNKLNYAIAFGFGTNLDIIEYKLKLKFGFRFQYTLTDMEGINGFGQTKENILIPATEKENFHNNALLGGIRFGLVYYFN
jgi:hypothetical protein